MRHKHLATSDPPADFTVEGELSDDAIEALAALLLSLVEQDAIEQEVESCK